MLTSHQLAEFFPDLSDERLISGLALVHSRFSTNTFPSWPLAHPYRYLAHNGEINTLAGNRNWMRAREALCADRPDPRARAGLPHRDPGRQRLGLVRRGAGAAPPRRPAAAPRRADDDPRGVGEPPDHGPGPPGLLPVPRLADGAVGRAGRGGLHRRHGDRRRPRPQRPAAGPLLGHRRRTGGAGQRGRGHRRRPPTRWCARAACSRAGCSWWTPRPAASSTTTRSRTTLAAEQPYAEWLDAGQIELEDLPPRTMLTPQHASVVGRQRLFGYTNEELRLILEPMAKSGAEPIGSMGTDTAIAVLSDRPRLLYDYFTQLFAQVTNPPLDAIREELVTSLTSTLGPEANLLEPTAESCRQIVLPMPVIDNDDLAKLLYVNEDGSTPGLPGLRHRRPVRGGRAAARPCARPSRTCGRRVSAAIADGADVIVLSDRNSTAELAPIPSLLLVSAVHHHLVRNKTRTRVGLVVESGDAREVHHMALLKGFGAAAINPYLAFETIDDMIASGILTGVTPRQAQKNYIKAASKGIIKVMSKMGISTVASYTGAQVFEAVGLAPDVVDEYFTGTVSRIGGVGLDVLADEVASRHRLSHLRPPDRAGPPGAGGGGRVPVAPRGRDPPVQPQDGVQAAARHPVQALRGVQGVHPGRRRPVGPPGHPAGPDAPADRRRCRPVPIDEVEPVAGHPGPVLHRGHVLRVDLGRGPRDAGHRHEPPRGAVQHRRGRRGPRPVHPGRQRRPAAQRHQAGGLGPVRGDLGVPGQRRRHPDQDRPGGQARRGRPAARLQGHARGSPRPGSRPPGSGSSRRRPTTTSTPSRTSPSSSTT